MGHRKTPENIPAEDGIIELDLKMFARNALRSFRHLWWICLLLVVLFSGFFMIRAKRSYVPLYRAQATFTVETYQNQDGYTFYYDNRTAAQMARTFPYLLDSDLLLDRVKMDLGVTYLNGTPKAEVIENSNMFTLSVVSKNPQDAYDILQAMIRNYPVVAEYVIGRVRVNMISFPEMPTAAYNETAYISQAVKGAALGVIVSLALIVISAVFRNTIHRESDVETKLHTRCFGSVPLVIPKGNRKEKKFKLSIHSNKVGTPFKESFRGISLHIDSAMDGRKVLLCTSTTQNEGTSTVALNLAYALADQGKQVLLLNNDFERSVSSNGILEQFYAEEITLAQLMEQVKKAQVSVLHCGKEWTAGEMPKVQRRLADLINEAKQNMDYIIIDAPPCQDFGKIGYTAELAEAIVYTIRYDSTKLNHIMNCFEDLNQYEARIIGCVLTYVQTGITGYGYGYGYGYGRNYQYGRYGYGYGYGEGITDEDM